MRATAEEQPGRKPRRRWLRRLVILAGVLIALRVALTLLLPVIVGALLGNFGLRCDWDRLDLSIHRLDLAIRHLELGPEDAEQPWLTIDSLRIDAGILALLGGSLHLNRVEIDDLVGVLELDADGWLQWAEAFAPDRDDTEQPVEAPPEARPAATAGGPPILFDLPLSVDALRINGARVHFIDRSRAEPTDFWADLSLQLTYLGSEERDSALKLSLRALDVLDDLRVDLGGRAAGTELDADLLVGLRGLRSEPANPWLELLGLRLEGERLDLRLQAELHSAAHQSQPDALALRAELHQIQVAVDDQQLVGIDTFETEAPLWSRERLQLTGVLTGVHGSAGRDSDGRLNLAGLTLLPAAPPSEATSEAPTPATDDVGPGFAFEVETLDLRDAQLSWRDQSTRSEVDTRLEIEQLSLRALELGPGFATSEPELQLTARLAGAFDHLTVQLGAEGPDAASLALQMTGVSLRSLTGYLAGVGLEPTMERGELSLRFGLARRQLSDGSVALDATADTIALSEGEQRHFGLRELDVSGLQFDSALRVETVKIAGLELPIVIRQDGSTNLLGLRTLATSGAASSDQAHGSVPPAAGSVLPAAETVAKAAVAAAPARIEIGSLHCEDLTPQLRVESAHSTRELKIGHSELVCEGIAIGGAPSEGKLGLQLDAPGVFEGLDLAGSIRSKPGPLDLTVEMALQVERLDGSGLSPWLSSFGLVPNWPEAGFQASFTAGVRSTEPGLEADASIADLRLDTEQGPLLELRSAALSKLLIGPDGQEIDSLKIAGLRLQAGRLANGAVLVAGVLPLAAEAKASQSPAAATPIIAGRDAGSSLRLHEASIEDSALVWSDRSLSPELDTELRIRAKLDDLTLAESLSAEIEVELGLEKSSLSLHGKADLGPDKFLANLDATAQLVDKQHWAPWFPPGVEPIRVDSTLRFGARAEAGPATDGGRKIEFELSEFDWTRQDRPKPPILALDSIHLQVDRLDPSRGVLHVADASINGLRGCAQRTARQRLELLGFAVVPKQQDGPTEIATLPIDTITGLDDPAATPSPEPSPFGHRSPWRDVRIERFVIDVARSSFIDTSTEHEGKATSSRLKISNAKPLVLADNSSDGTPAWQLQIDGDLAPLIGEIHGDLRLAPWHIEPEASLELSVAGIDGGSLTDVLPALAERLDAGGADQGSAELRLSATFDIKRRGPLDFDFSEGFGVDLILDRLKIQTRPDEDPVFSLSAALLDVERVFPNGSAQVNELLILEPYLRLARYKDGLDFGGLRLRLDDAAATKPPTAGPTVAAPAKHGLGPEVWFKKIELSGLRIDYENQVADPITRVPIADIEAEIEDFSTAMFAARRPAQFRIYVNGGKVDLPKPSESSGFIRDAISGAADFVTRQQDKMPMKHLNWLEELTIEGRVEMYPKPTGSIRSNISRLELLNFRGNGAESGVLIGDGILDAGVDLYLNGAQGIDVNSRFVFTDLYVSEPPGGPISSFLKLPAPLQTVLWVLRNNRGEQVVPLQFHVDAKDGISRSQVTREATKTLGLLITEAIATSPLRLGQVITDFVGITGGPRQDVRDLATRVGFAAGDATPVLSPETEAKLGPLIDEIRSDSSLVAVLRHAFSKQDLELMKARANPSKDEALRQVGKLRYRRAQLAQRQRSISDDLRQLWTLGRSSEAHLATKRLRTIESAYARNEQAIDEVMELLRPNASRRAGRRSRGYAIHFAEERSSALQDLLIRRDIPPARIEIRHPRFDMIDQQGGSVTVTPAPRMF